MDVRFTVSAAQCLMWDINGNKHLVGLQQARKNTATLYRNAVELYNAVEKTIASMAQRIQEVEKAQAECEQQLAAARANANAEDSSVRAKAKETIAKCNKTLNSLPSVADMERDLDELKRYKTDVRCLQSALYEFDTKIQGALYEAEGHTGTITREINGLIDTMSRYLNIRV